MSGYEIDATLVAIDAFGDRHEITDEAYIASICDADNPHIRDLGRIFVTFGGRRDWYEDNETWTARCPACGAVIDYCQGHGEIGDPDGAAILSAHDDGDHRQCVIDCDTE